MNSKSLRRLAADHSALHSQPLPPNYLFAPDASDGDDLTQLDILLAGPTHTPFAAGVWKLHLTIPPNYPQAPPTANFRTPIFHPNVDTNTGGVCVETLKRDWDPRLTLRDVLVTISCLLIQPNPDSALNAEAGALIQDDYNGFARRAKLMTSIHAVVPPQLRRVVKEAQSRGQEIDAGDDSEDSRDLKDVVEEQSGAPAKRRKIAARRIKPTIRRRSGGSPTATAAQRRFNTSAIRNPFILQPTGHDPFAMNTSTLPQETPKTVDDDQDSSMMDADQENDETRSPSKSYPPSHIATPRRPFGKPVPLGELSMDELMSDASSSDFGEMDLEYPPSPRKSPRKGPHNRDGRSIFTNNQANIGQPESSRDALERAPQITPPMNVVKQPLAEDSPFAFSVSPRKLKAKAIDARHIAPPQFGAAQTSATSFASETSVRVDHRPHSSPQNADHHRAELNAKLWSLCGEDIHRWNRGQFDGDVLKMKARRW